MISDYHTPLGGIEQYLVDASALLNSNNIHTTIVGLTRSTKKLRHIRSLLLLTTLCNIGYAIKLIYRIFTKKPQLLWWNSVVRYIGWFPIWVAHLWRIPMRMMYHDLGYFHPYPSLLTSVEQIPSSRTLSQRLQSGYDVGKTSPLHKILMTCKFWSVSCVRSILIKHITTHLVPSDFMVPIVQQWGVSSDKVKVLGHFGRMV